VGGSSSTIHRAATQTILLGGEQRLFLKLSRVSRTRRHTEPRLVYHAALAQLGNRPQRQIRRRFEKGQNPVPFARSGPWLLATARTRRPSVSGSRYEHLAALATPTANNFAVSSMNARR
jgi:hypothetical protein